MNVPENIVRYSVGRVARLPQQNTVFKNDAYSNSTFNLRIKNLLKKLVSWRVVKKEFFKKECWKCLQIVVVLPVNG